jgi:Spy/CpxP family protein refolding chaperone
LPTAVAAAVAAVAAAVAAAPRQLQVWLAHAAGGDRGGCTISWWVGSGRRAGSFELRHSWQAGQIKQVMPTVENQARSGTPEARART